jgi:formylglycine-generating enzyme required for sulfatase activity
VDQYALAVTVYEMLSGEKPFKGDRAHIIVEHSGLPVPPLSAKVPGLAQSLCMAVERGLAKKSEERFATCGEFAAAVVAELAVLQPEPDTVRLLCPSCKNILKLPQKAAGSTGKCPRCQTAMDVAADLGSLWLESEERGGGAVAKVQSAASPEAAAETFAEVRPRRGWGVKEWAALALAACCGLAVGYPWGVSVNAAKAQREFRETEFTWQSERANLGAAQEALAGQNRQLETEGAELRNAKEALAAERDKLREAQEAMAAGNRSLAENAKTANEARMNVARDYEQLAMRLKTLAAENGRLVEDSKAANEVRKNLASDNVELEMRLKTSVAELLARAPRPTLPDEASSAGPVPKRVTNSIGMELIRIPKGEFMMGSPTTEKNRAAPAEDQVRVTISRDFLLGKTEVTRGQWTTVMETTPWRGSGGKSNDDLPAANVSWDDARAFCWKLTVREWGSGRLAANEAYRLPTEAEWEYACRAGTTTVFSFGNEESQLGNFGWFGWSDGNSGGKAHPVGTKKPNPWGLYDMHGNEAEWCSDWFSIGLDGGVDPVGPVVPVGNEGSGRISRGGGWWHDPKDCRSARRSCSSWPADQHDYQGFRVARSQLVK